jgi:hypothetical protein
LTRTLHRDLLDAARSSLQTGGMSPTALTRGSGPEASGPEAVWEPAPFGPPIRIVVLSILSVPFLHLYLRVDLSAFELLVHALDIGLAAALACALGRGATRMLGQQTRWPIRRRARIALSMGVTVLSVSLFVFAFQGLLPGTDAILERHVRAGYGDMGLRVIPLAALLGYLALTAERRSRLRREVAELRAARVRIAELEPPTPIEEEAPLALAHGGGVLRVPPREVLRVEAMENYCEFVLRPEAEQGTLRRVLMRMTLVEARQKLPLERFAQPHRSHLVQLSCVRAVVREGRATWLDLGPAGRVPVSRTQRAEILARIARPPASYPTAAAHAQP